MFILCACKPQNSKVVFSLYRSWDLWRLVTDILLSKTSSLCTQVPRCEAFQWYKHFCLFYRANDSTGSELFSFWNEKNTQLSFSSVTVNCSLSAKKVTIDAWTFMRRSCVLSLYIPEWEQININTSNLSLHYSTCRRDYYFFFSLTV